MIDVAQQARRRLVRRQRVGRGASRTSRTTCMRQYVQWQIQWADTTGGGCEDCEVRSTYLIPGFEAFKSANVQFIRPKGINAMFAMNGSGGWLIDDADLRFTANSLPPESDRYAASPGIRSSTSTRTSASRRRPTMGGTIRNMTMIQDGYVNAANDTLGGIRDPAEQPRHPD